MICLECRGYGLHDEYNGVVFTQCDACGGSGVAYCCGDAGAGGIPMFSVKPEWAKTAAEYPIVKAG